MSKRIPPPTDKQPARDRSKLKMLARFINKFSIGKKLNLGFGILVGLTFLVITLNFTADQTVTQNLNRVEDLRMPTSLTSATAQANLLKMMAAVRGYLVLDNPQYIAEYQQIRQDFETNLADLESLSKSWTNPQNIERLNQLNLIFEEWAELPAQLFALHDNPRENQPALRIARLEVQPLNNTILTEIEEMISVQEQREISDKNIILLKEMVNFRASFKTMITGLRAYATTQDLTSKFTYTTNLTENEAAWDALLAKKLQLADSQQIRLNIIANTRTQLLKLPIRIIEVIESEHAHEDLYLFKTETVPRAEQMLALLDKMINNQQALLRSDLNSGRERLINAQWQTFAGGVLALTLGIGMAILFGQNIVGLVRRLINTAEQIAAGDLTARVSVESGDEIGRLAVTFNTMANRLSKTINRLEEAHDELEQRVEDRTLKLSLTNASLQDQIAERKRAEETLAEERNLLRVLIDNLPDFVYVKDTGSRFVTANNTVARLMGAASAGNLYGKTDFDFYPQELATLYRADELAIFQAGEAMLSKEEPCLDSEGNHRWVLTSKIPLRDNQGEIMGLVGIGHDITARKKNEQERESLIEELEAKNTELERFTYTVSHDLKSPLVTIRGFVGMLEQDALKGNSERMKQDIQFINTATDQMKNLLDDLLELSRIGRMVNPSQNISLSNLVHEAVELVAGQIRAREVEVIIMPDMPAIYGDRPRLLEVLQNLIDNAVKYMGDQPNPRIKIGTAQNEEETTCFVQDNGMGIASRYHDKVFGLFDRLDTTTEGTGIGLALVKRIIEVHGGRIWVESKGEGSGSTFCFTLPETLDKPATW